MMVKCHNVSFIQVLVNDAVGMPKQKDYDFIYFFKGKRTRGGCFKRWEGEGGK